ncbi:MAG TPA: BT_3928 family protein [Candidatus Sphingobacterium stercoripullorum]|nr:BT_3928 family protein [Candidatus Sphingobacterium stercoripullorum]
MQNNLSSQSNNSKSISNSSLAILWFCRVFVGLLFIFSGLIKANDPIGFGLKLEEYFLVFKTTFLDPYSAWIAIFLCGLEIILGALLLLGNKAKSVAWGLLLLIVFFTFLTFYSAFFEVVSSCGCFGDAIPLTPWQSFIKDLVLLALIIYIFRYRKNITPIIKNEFTRGLVGFFVFVFSFGIGIYTYNYLPFIDFLPYKVGNNIPELMVMPEGKQGDVYEHVYNLENKETGEKKTMSDKQYMDEKVWEDESWEIIGEPTSKLVKKGYEIPIPDLLISDSEGFDMTDEIINNPYYNFLVVTHDITQLDALDLRALNKINLVLKELSIDYNIRTILLTASSMNEAYHLNEELDLILETFYADGVPLKSMVRSNPGVLLLQNGNVVNKWSKQSFPSKEELERNYLNR